MNDIQASLNACDTFPKLLLRNAAERRDHPAYREKEFGIWQTWSWSEAAGEIRALAMGLMAIGLQRGNKVAIIGQNRPQLYWAFDAVESFGGVPVPLYADSVADEMRYVLDHAEVRACICEDQEQIDKILQVREGLPSVEFLVYEDPRGLRKYDAPGLHAYADIQEKGRQLDAAEPDRYLQEVAEAKGDDLAIIAYTSGTTGQPKGVMLSHANLLTSAGLAAKTENITEAEDMLAYLPLAWVGDHFFSVAQQHVVGFTINCPEHADTVTSDLREVGPTSFIAPPAIFETFLTSVQIRMEDASGFKKSLYRYFMKIAEKVGIDLLEGRPVGLMNRILYGVGELAVYGPLKNNLGFSRMRHCYTGGAPLGEEVFRFYRSLGVNLKQLYGQTESSAYVCIQRNGDVSAETVGPPSEGVELKISDSGEVIYKSPGTFIGYFKNDAATRETIDAEGWVHTGDAGIINDRGHLKIIDRAKDVGTLADGTLFAPQYIENKLKFFPQIKEVVAHGADRDKVTCFINIDLEAVSNWAERNGISYTSYVDLAAHDQVYDLMAQHIQSVNRDLAKDSALAGAQVRRFLILHKELDADDGELTRTRKVRRRIIAERYDPLIAALYDGSHRVNVETQVTFEDGRKGTMKADLRIMDVNAEPATAKAA